MKKLIILSSLVILAGFSSLQAFRRGGGAFFGGLAAGSIIGAGLSSAYAHPYYGAYNYPYTYGGYYSAPTVWIG